MFAKRFFLIGGGTICATLSMVSAVLVYIFHSNIGPIAAGQPVPVLLYRGNPFFEQLSLTTCIVFGVITLALVMISRKTNGI